jgi:hypothetical protein
MAPVARACAPPQRRHRPWQVPDVLERGALGHRLAVQCPCERGRALIPCYDTGVACLVYVVAGLIRRLVVEMSILRRVLGVKRLFGFKNPLREQHTRKQSGRSGEGYDYALESILA